MQACIVTSFEDWRQTARVLLANSVPPANVHFQEDGLQRHLFYQATCDGNAAFRTPTTVRVPRQFLDLARLAACHRDSSRFEILYRVLWRLTHAEPHLLEITTDDDVHRLQKLAKAVRRDAHKMKAFVRFRRVVVDGNEHFIAWHRPDHRIVQLVAPFFSRRFPSMNWTILTPDEAVVWDGQQLRYSGGAPSTAAPRDDELEELWKTYYASIFNPSRVKLAAMKREMPVRHWKTLPETNIIPDLLADASRRVSEMVELPEVFGRSAATYLPAERAIESLREAASCCQGCNLYCHATQTVFGEGPSPAQIMFVGEQPGDMEDIAGRPFVGPAGNVFDDALKIAGLNRRDVYVTNAVKHFKFMLRGKRRIHNKPSIQEAIACHPWLQAEIGLVQPKVLVCLGATAAQALIGTDFRLSRQRGQFVETVWCAATIATFHPSAVLRAPDLVRRDAIWTALVSDLKLSASHIRSERTGELGKLS